MLFGAFLPEYEAFTLSMRYLTIDFLCIFEVAVSVFFVYLRKYNNGFIKISTA